MKTIIIPALLFVLFYSQSFSQSVDDILTQHFEVIGQEKLLATETFSTKGKIIQGQFEIPFTSLS